MEEQSETTAEIHPDRLYGVEEVRKILSPSKPLHPDTVYRIPERMLPKTKVGPRRGLTKWKGRDLMRYLGIDSHDVRVA